MAEQLVEEMSKNTKCVGGVEAEAATARVYRSQGDGHHATEQQDIIMSIFSKPLCNSHHVRSNLSGACVHTAQPDRQPLLEPCIGYSLIPSDWASRPARRSVECNHLVA
jgi:hypothetical protein